MNDKLDFEYEYNGEYIKPFKNFTDEGVEHFVFVVSKLREICQAVDNIYDTLKTQHFRNKAENAHNETIRNLIAELGSNGIELCNEISAIKKEIEELKAIKKQAEDDLLAAGRFQSRCAEWMIEMQKEIEELKNANKTK